MMTWSHALTHWSPATYATLLVVGLLLVLAALLRWGGRAGRPAATRCPDAGCGHQNPPNARYCARCGRALREHPDH